MKSPISRATLAVLALFVSAVSVQAQSISFNFNSDRELGGLLPDDSAGVVPSVNWNNFNDISSAAGPYTQSEVDIDSPNAGVVTQGDGTQLAGVTTSWTANNSWNTNNGLSNNENKLMNGYLDNNGANPTIALDITGIPAAFTDEVGYTVIAYFGSDGNDRSGTVGITGGDTFSYNTFSQQGGTFPQSYLQTTDTGAGNPQANYARWDNVKTTDLTITIQRGSNNSGIHGVQIVGTGAISPLAISDIGYNKDNDTFTISWNFKTGRVYSLFASTGLADWGLEVADSIPSKGETTTFGPFPNPIAGASKLFFRVEEIPTP